MSPEDFQDHLKAILGSPRIRGKLVVLCEGDRPPPSTGAPSPQTYRQQGKLPDASFYGRCVPSSWQGWNLPRFFNCGDRVTVLRTFSGLLALAREEPAASYLDPEKLFALVDLDQTPQETPEGYPWPDTEAIHRALYTQCLLNESASGEHKIWVTAMVHKEAYYFLPATFSRLQEDQATLDGAPLTLASLCQAAARQLEPGGPASDKGLALHFDALLRRVQPFLGALQDPPSDLQGLWRHLTGACESPDRALVFQLFLLSKAKPLWKRVAPSPSLGWTRPDWCYRDVLALALAEGISKQEGSQHPLAAFFSFLKGLR